MTSFKKKRKASSSKKPKSAYLLAIEKYWDNPENSPLQQTHPPVFQVLEAARSTF